MPLVGQGYLTVEASRSYSDTQRSVGLLWNSDQPEAENSTWQHRALTRNSIHAPDGIRTHNPSQRVAPNPCLRPHGPWDQHLNPYYFEFIISDLKIKFEWK
jgi:hypothetical protein